MTRRIYPSASIPLRVRDRCGDCGRVTALRAYPAQPGQQTLGDPCPSCGSYGVSEASRPCPPDHWVLRLVLRALERAATELPRSESGRWGGLSERGHRLCQRAIATAPASRWWRTPLYACAVALVSADGARGLAARTRSPTAHARHRQRVVKHLDEFWQRLRSVPLPPSYDARAAERALQAAEWQS